MSAKPQPHNASLLQFWPSVWLGLSLATYCPSATSHWVWGQSPSAEMWRLILPDDLHNLSSVTYLSCKSQSDVPTPRIYPISFICTKCWTPDNNSWTDEWLFLWVDRLGKTVFAHSFLSSGWSNLPFPLLKAGFNLVLLVEVSQRPCPGQYLIKFSYVHFICSIMEDFPVLTEVCAEVLWILCAL